jgi:hypothetical protein
MPISDVSEVFKRGTDATPAPINAPRRDVDAGGGQGPP